jgi:hypothetical protein
VSSLPLYIWRKCALFHYTSEGSALSSIIHLMEMRSLPLYIWRKCALFHYTFSSSTWLLYYSIIQSDITDNAITLFDIFLTVHHSIDLFHNQLNTQFLYSITICMLHYNPRRVSSINMPIFRRTNCIITASGIVTLCTVQYSVPDERSLLSSGIPYSRLQRVTISDAVKIQFVLLKMGMLTLETCRGL